MLDRLIQLAVVHDDDRSLAAQLQRHLCDVGGSSLHDLLAGCRGSRHGDHLHFGAGGKHIAHNGAGSGDHIDDALGKRALLDQLGELIAAVGGVAGGLEHDRTARHQDRSHFAADQEEREVPGHDACHDAQRHLVHENILIGAVGGDDLSFDMTRHFREIIEIFGQPAGLVHGLCQRLAHLFRIGPCEQLAVVGDQLCQLADVAGTYDGRRFGPLFLRGGCGIDRRFNICRCCFGNLGDHFLRRGVDDLQHFAVSVRDEFAIDKQLVRSHDYLPFLKKTKTLRLQAGMPGIS